MTPNFLSLSRLEVRIQCTLTCFWFIVRELLPLSSDLELWNFIHISIRQIYGFENLGSELIAFEVQLHITITICVERRDVRPQENVNNLTRINLSKLLRQFYYMTSTTVFGTFSRQSTQTKSLLANVFGVKCASNLLPPSTPNDDNSNLTKTLSRIYIFISLAT